MFMCCHVSFASPLSNEDNRRLYNYCIKEIFEFGLNWDISLLLFRNCQIYTRELDVVVLSTANK